MVLCTGWSGVFVHDRPWIYAWVDGKSAGIGRAAPVRTYSRIAVSVGVAALADGVCSSCTLTSP